MERARYLINSVFGSSPFMFLLAFALIVSLSSLIW